MSVKRELTPSVESNVAYFGTLPDELLLQVASLLQNKDACQFGQTCKKLNGIVKESLLCNTKQERAKIKAEIDSLLQEVPLIAKNIRVFSLQKFGDDIKKISQKVTVKVDEFLATTKTLKALDKISVTMEMLMVDAQMRSKQLNLIVSANEMARLNEGLTTQLVKNIRV